MPFYMFFVTSKTNLCISNSTSGCLHSKVSIGNATAPVSQTESVVM